MDSGFYSGEYGSTTYFFYVTGNETYSEGWDNNNLYNPLIDDNEVLVEDTDYTDTRLIVPLELLQFNTTEN